MKSTEEAIKQAAKKYSDLPDYFSISKHSREKAFEEGAKSPEAKAFHTQGMYTEDDMVNFAHFVSLVKPGSLIRAELLKDWLEQNKKKS